MESINYILEARSIYKLYGHVTALEDVTMQLKNNEILAILGDNGAGKSTLIKIISGAILPDMGEIFIEGMKVQFNEPRDAKKAGIETVYQNLALVECLSVAKNLYLGKEVTKKYGFLKILQNKIMEKNSGDFLMEFGIDLEDISIEVENLSGGQRQSVAISKSVFWSRKILILDEPTAALGVKESGKVLDLILNLKEKGISIIVITHNMEHAFQIADRFFVLNLGKKVGDRKREETDVDEIVKMITGGIRVKR